MGIREIKRQLSRGNHFRGCFCILSAFVYLLSPLGVCVQRMRAGCRAEGCWEGALWALLGHTACWARELRVNWETCVHVQHDVPVVKGFLSQRIMCNPSLGQKAVLGSLEWSHAAHGLDQTSSATIRDIFRERNEKLAAGENEMCGLRPS